MTGGNEAAGGTDEAGWIDGPGELGTRIGSLDKGRLGGEPFAMSISRPVCASRRLRGGVRSSSSSLSSLKSRRRAGLGVGGLRPTPDVDRATNSP